jgi:hypothetical protein
MKTFSILSGTILELSGLLLGFLLLLSTYASPHPILSFTLLMISWFCFWFFSHCLTHFVIGKLLGIDFRFYFVGKSSIVKLNFPLISKLMSKVPVLGIKINRKSFLRVSQRRRAVMFASGAIASMGFPVFSLVYALLFLEPWMTMFLSALTVGNAVFTVLFSFKVGDLWKAKRTLER